MEVRQNGIQQRQEGVTNVEPTANFAGINRVTNAKDAAPATEAAHHETPMTCLLYPDH